MLPSSWRQSWKPVTSTRSLGAGGTRAASSQLVGDARAEINVVDDARRKTPLDLAAEVSVLAPSPDAEAVLRILREETVRSVVQLAMEYKWAHLW